MISISARRRASLAGTPDAAAILAALPAPVVAVDRDERIRYVNPAAEQFFGQGASQLVGRALSDFLAPHSPLLSLVDGVWNSGNTVCEYDMLLEGPRLGSRSVTIQGAVAGERELILTLHERGVADKMDRGLTHRGAARSLTAVAAMMAHEVKNPLSGIRGAAQLLERDVDEGGRELTRLICDETDRIVALVDRMDAFSDGRPLERIAVNIHEVLERVRKLAQSGFAGHARIVERYDPSLPSVHGNFDMLVQVFLNLVKNAAEAVAAGEGEIVLATAYRHGLRLALEDGGRQHLPLMVSITDNGRGIPDDLRSCLFDPFVSAKRNGTGLGLALVAKAVGDHGGVIEFDSQPQRTEFRVFLPVAAQPGSPP